MKNMDETKHKDTNHVKSEWYEKHEEVSVIPPSNAVVDPGTVMVEYFNAVIADTAVAAPGRTVELTRHAPFHTNLNNCQIIDTLSCDKELFFFYIP